MTDPAPCPHCATPFDAGSRFCEVCGYDPDTGSLPEAPAVVPAKPAATPARTPAPSPTGGAAAASGAWCVVVTPDRAYYDRNALAEVQFPIGVPARVIELAAGRPHAIGRRSPSRGTDPEIDLGGPPDDVAVSHTHASLLPHAGGDWELVDHGSTNGTFLNESPDPITPNTPRPVSAGDRVYVGAWTKLTLERRS